MSWSGDGRLRPAASNRRMVNRTVEGGAPIRRAISRLGSPAAFILITSRTRRIASLSVGIQATLRKAERTDPMGARRGRVTRATSSRNAGRDRLGTGGRLQVGMVFEIISERWATSSGIRTARSRKVRAPVPVATTAQSGNSNSRTYRPTISFTRAAPRVCMLGGNFAALLRQERASRCFPAAPVCYVKERGFDWTPLGR